MALTPYFPLFINLNNKKILIYGAGTIAGRRIDALLPFGPDIHVISPNIPAALRQQHSSCASICWTVKGYEPGEINRCDLVLACTDNPETNHAIYMECKEKQIPANNASNQKECDFFFPAIIQSGDITLGLCSGGRNHRQVKETAQTLRNYLRRPDNEND